MSNSSKILSLLLIGLLSCCDQNPKKTQENLSNIFKEPEKSRSTNIVVFFTDDQGFSDLGVQNQLDDLKTPNIDSIAKSGVIATNAYVTAPQCTPSRGAVHTGLYQQSFGLDDNRYTPMPLDVFTVSERLKDYGYVTGMTGKWHLEINSLSLEWAQQNYPDLIENNRVKIDEIPFDNKKLFYPNHRGFDDVYFGHHHEYWATYDQEGTSQQEAFIQDNRYRVDIVSDASIKFIQRHHDEPFFLHIAHYAPHVPLQALGKYLGRFSDDMQVRRRYALAMMSAIDDGVGRVIQTLKDLNIYDNTLIIFMSDNGAPLGMELTDAPINDKSEAWNGSLNTPMLGEKGMLTEGGIRVPFVAQWPDVIKPGTFINNPISSLDIGATSLAIAGAKPDVLEQLHGVNLLPAFKGDEKYLASRPLYWRFWSQSAIRQGEWKYLRLGNSDNSREFLFNMSDELPEDRDYLQSNPNIAEKLKNMLKDWDSMLPREKVEHFSKQEKALYDYYLPRDQGSDN